MFTLYTTTDCIHSYKIRLVAAQLNIPHRIRLLDTGDENLRRSFLALNPIGTTPFAVLDQGGSLCEANAAIWYLSRGSRLFPASSGDEAIALEWLLVERALKDDLSLDDTAERLASHLTNRDFVTGKQYTIADVALYATLHHQMDRLVTGTAEQLQAWTARVEATTLFIPAGSAELAA
ncbi:MAG: glutathione S-transferase family protein [Pseudomonadota bacterium]